MPDRKLSARYPTDLPAWRSLKDHYRDRMKNRRIGYLFSKDPQRAERYTIEAGDLVLDYSKNLIDERARRLLMQLAKQARVPEAVESMFAGAHVNLTEDRAALHVALRAKLSDRVALDTPGVAEVWQVLDRMEQFIEGVTG
ncbi:MAG: glucose-6-phosphate isomerase, partial [Gammaproteobacteria bacterium]|nr:glucose-6-phosphate isomerase [Gammaproteobacteria bacterium]